MSAEIFGPHHDVFGMGFVYEAGGCKATNFVSQHLTLTVKQLCETIILFCAVVD
jgi:hypothetical protein